MDGMDSISALRHKPAPSFRNARPKLGTILELPQSAAFSGLRTTSVSPCPSTT